MKKIFRAYLTKIKDLDTEVLYLPGYSHNIALIIKQAREIGLDCLFTASSGFEDPEVFEIAGDSTEGTIYTIPAFDPDNEDIQNYMSAFREKYGEESGFIEANSYDAIKILALAIEVCGGDEDTDCIRDYLYSVKDYPGVGGLTSFDENGDVIKPIELKIVQDGKFVRYKEGRN